MESTLQMERTPRKRFTSRKKIAANSRSTSIRKSMMNMKSLISKRGGPRVAAQVEKAVLTALAAVKIASSRRWVRGPPPKSGRNGRLVRVNIPSKKFGVKGDAPAPAPREPEGSRGPMANAPVSDAAAAAMRMAEGHLPPAMASKVNALLDASLIYKTKVENGNTLEVRLSQIDEHGLGLYIMNDIGTEKKICDYSGLLVPGNVPEGTSYTAVPISGMELYISPDSEEENVGRYAYPCEHVPDRVCNARLVVDDDKMEAYVVSTKYIIAGSEIFLRWPRSGARHFSKGMEDKIVELSMIEDKFLEETSQWVPHNRGFMPVDYVENLVHHMIRYAKTPKNPHMHFNDHVLALMYERREGEPPKKKKRGSGQVEEGYIPVYDRLEGTPNRDSQLPRPEGGTVIIVGSPSHFAVWKFIARGHNKWDSYVIDSLNVGYDSTSKIIRGLNYFREEAAAHGMNITVPTVINLGWQGKTVWSTNACGVFAAFVTYTLMISDVEDVDPNEMGFKPSENMIKNLMTLVSRIVAKRYAEWMKPVKK